MSASRHTYVVVLIVEDKNGGKQRAVCTDWRSCRFAAYGSEKKATEYRDLIAAEFPDEVYEVIQLR